MGGRENPNEMWHTPSYTYCVDTLMPVKVSGPMIRGDKNKVPKYYKFPELSNPVKVNITGMEILEFAPLTGTSDDCHSIRDPDLKKPLSTPAAVSSTGKESTAHTGLGTILKVVRREPTAAFIMKTLREAFYINDSINHLLDHLKYYDVPENTEQKKNNKLEHGRRHYWKKHCKKNYQV